MDPSIDDPNDFESKDLQKMDQHLRCAICKELYTSASMITSCSHSFCSLCVHRCLSEETVCPQCRKEAFTNNIVPNPDLDNFVRLWQNARKTLQSVDNILHGKSDPIETLPRSTQRRSSRLEKKTEDAEKWSSPSRETTGEEKLSSTTLVECPICAQHMKYVVLDKHLDGCMKGDSRIPPSPPSRPLASSSKTVYLGKKPGKVVYAMQTDKDMKKILKDLGLPEEGDKAQKIWRHREYSNLYHANVDCHKPVSMDTLLRRLAEMERTQGASKNNQAKRKHFDADTYNDKYKDEFTKLIQAAQKRKKPSKEKDS
ncbi:hypothetical protein BY458DRAFT_510355 [Sporodiniella umbellata]|nr:hypothetical protein BY458DRAFT_510355 [Sporodiniella umbellata]